MIKSTDIFESYTNSSIDIYYIDYLKTTKPNTLLHDNPPTF